jgi:plastocyanin
MKTIKAHQFNFRHSAIALIALFALPIPSLAATIHGTTDASVVWVSAPDALPKPGVFDVHNQDREFLPPLTVIPQGSSVRFPNDDPFLHSIYSASPADPFDIGFYANGPGKTVDFPKAGIIDLHCHIHASMHGTIVVTDGPYALAANGAYSVSNVPAGKHVLHAWDETHGERTMNITVPNASSNLTQDVRR